MLRMDGSISTHDDSGRVISSARGPDRRALGVARRLALLVLGVVALELAPALALAQGPPPARVRLDEARMETVALRRSLVGALRPAKRSEVAAEEAGLVVELDLDVGDRVEAGEVLARLDDALLRLDAEALEADVAASTAEIEERKAEVEQAVSDLRRIEDLDRSGGANERELERARTSLSAAQARLARAEAEARSMSVALRRAERRIEDMVIRAPYAGQVTSKFTELGQWISPGDPVVGLIWLDAVDAYLNVPESFLAPLVRDDATVTITVDPLGLTFEDLPPVLVSAGDPVARTFPVRVRLSNPDGVLRPGMTITASVPTNQTGEAMTIHKDGVLRNDVGSFVYFDAGGFAAVAPVDVSFQVGDRVVVRSPALRAGSLVVIEGNERLFPGQPLTPVGPGERGGGVERAAGGESGERRSEAPS